MSIREQMMVKKPNGRVKKIAYEDIKYVLEMEPNWIHVQKIDENMGHL